MRKEGDAGGIVHLQGGKEDELITIGLMIALLIGK
jgi:hypothetical protein